MVGMTVHLIVWTEVNLKSQDDSSLHPMDQGDPQRSR